MAQTAIIPVLVIKYYLKNLTSKVFWRNFVYKDNRYPSEC